jgi:MOSC domain-containing protein
MTAAAGIEAGTVLSLWRYPVKSMIGEELAAARVSKNGIVGDRAWGLRDRTDGKIATAKNPRKWPNLFAYRAAYDRSSTETDAGALRIGFPDGTIVNGLAARISEMLSSALGRDVALVSAQAQGTPPAAAEATAQSEEYWPDIEGLDHRDTVTDFTLPSGTFFDCATVHVLTTATLAALRQHHPQGRFEVPRFRPNIVVAPEGNGTTYAEDSWIGRTLAIGGDVRLQITGPCGRCVMTTLAQGDLPKDTDILRTAVRHNRANVGVYASVVRGGTIRKGDRVTVSGLSS